MSNYFHAKMLANPQFQADLAGGLSSRKMANKWGVGRTFIQNHRSQPQPDFETPTQPNLRASTSQQSSDGSRTLEAIRDRPVTLTDAREWIAASGDNADDFEISIRSIAYGVDMFSNRMSATPKKGRELAKAVAAVDYVKLAERVAGFTYQPARKDFLVDACVLQPTDEQWGKTDFNGGSAETVERVLKSYSGFVDYVREYRPRTILLAKTGDGIENFCSAPGQMHTNDMDLPHQIAAMYGMDLTAVRMFASEAEKVIAAYVPSNHGAWRSGMKSNAGDAHSDFGIANAKMLRDTLEQFDTLPNVEIVIPELHMESMSVQVSPELRVGLVHGHQAGGSDKIGDWWAKQDHGRMPTWDADVLFVGHWHSYRAYQSGDGRAVFVGPASDPGSSWFSNLKGERATSGMLAVSFEGKRWKYQEIM